MLSPLKFTARICDAMLNDSDRHGGRPVPFMNTQDSTLLYIEAAMAYMYSIRNARSKTCILVASCTFYSVITGLSASGSILRIMDQLSEELQDHLPFFQTGTDWLDVCDNLYSNIGRLRKSAAGNKIISVFNHVLAHAFYTKMGIAVDPKLFSRFEEKKMRPTVWECLSFTDAVVSLFLFLAKAGRQAMRTGSIESFFVDDTVVAKWLDEAAALRKDAEFLSNPAVIGTTVPLYLSKVDASIEVGTQLSKVFKTGQQHTIIHSVLLELKLVKNRHMCSLTAASFRRAPVGVFLYGTAGVAKSFLAAGLFNHYCSVRGVPKENAYCWTRDDNDDYYSGYKSHYVGVLYDDAAKFRANKVQGVDPSIKDIISAINNIPFITNQAELADKGKVPFLSEWVGVTSNLGDLNADQYYNSSAAFLRRLQVRITPIVKLEFRIEGEDRIDARLIPEGEQYPDLWEFEVSVPQVNGMKGEFVKVHHFQHYSELLGYMTIVYERHIATQDKLMLTASKIGPEELCVCRMPKSICQCVKPHNHVLAFGPLEVPVVSQMRSIFGSDYSDSDTDSVAFDEDSVVSTNDRIEAMWELRQRMERTYCINAPAKLYFKQLMTAGHVSDLFDTSYCTRGDWSGLVDEAQEEIEGSMRMFNNMKPRSQLDVLTENTFTIAQQEDGESYLDFTPRLGVKCFFMQEQLQKLKDIIMGFVPIKMSDVELTLLDDYMYKKVPQYVSDGWPTADIVRGALCYINKYKSGVVDHSRLVARDALLQTVDKPTFTQRVTVWLACQYFERSWFRSLCNGVWAYTPVRYVVGSSLNTTQARASRAVVVRAARAYDVSLGGKSPFVVIIIGLCSSALVLTLIYKLVGRFTTKKKDVPVLPPPRFCKYTGKPIHECDFCELTEYHIANSQMNLMDVGSKPVVREQEKANVWTVAERNITRLDVDPRRPQDSDQAVNKLKNNTLYAEFRGDFDGRMGRAINRVLAIDRYTLVTNNHAVHTPSVMTVWFGPRTDTGVQPSVKIDVTEAMVKRIPERDLCIIKTMGLPVLFKNISSMLPKKTYQSVGPSFYLLKKEDGEVERVRCSGASQAWLNAVRGAVVDHICWRSVPSRPTEYGECGMPLLVQSPLGCVIVGLHTGYSFEDNVAWSVPIFYEDFDHTTCAIKGELEPVGVLAQVFTTFEDLQPRDKLFTDYHKDGHLMVHGQLKGFRPRAKFSGTKTPYAEHVLCVGTSFDPPIVDRMAAPVAHPWKQPQMVLENYLHPTHSIDETRLLSCVEAYVDHIMAGLTDEDKLDIHPVPLSVAVNGYPGVPNIDSQKMTTSGGHGFRGPKLQFLSEPEAFEEWTHYRSYNDVVTSRVDKIMEDATLGIRPHAIYTSCMKDEMLSKAKVALGKARCIYMCPVDFLTSMRMLTLGLTRVMVRRRDLFGIAVGLNTHSEEWDALYELSNSLPGNNWIAGDFKAFESVLCILLSNCASKVLVDICQKSGGFTEPMLLALETLLADTVNPTIDFFGTLITLMGGEASGHQLTTFFNCICNQLLHMYAYVCTQSVVEDKTDDELAKEFFTHVVRNTLGDDVYLKVHPQKSQYNHTSIQSVFASIGITYTMADKLAVSVPYIPWQEVSFLKRHFVEHSEFPGMKVAALDKESIYKMLLYTIPSSSTSQEEQLASAMASAQAEAFFHDRQFFDQISDLIDGIPKSAELKSRVALMPRPTWGVMVRRFITASPKLQAKMLVPGEIAETSSPMHSYCHGHSVVLQTSWSVDAWGSTTMERPSEECIYTGVRLSPKRAHKLRRTEKKHADGNTLLSKQQEKQQDFEHGNLEMTHPAVKSVIKKMHSKRISAQKKLKWKGVVAQADFEYDTVSVPGKLTGDTTNTEQETTAFVNEPAGEVLVLTDASQSKRQSMDMPQDLAKYLMRPRQIGIYAWAENGSDGFKVSITPWQLFFAASDTQKKLSGFSLLSANLHVKFMINGSPFYYGSMLANYTPLAGWRSDTAASLSSSVSLVAASQKPHVWLENQNMSSAEMVLPFLSPYPYIDISDSNQLTRFGQISLIQYAPLLSANGTSSSTVDIQIYGWATDVHLGGPTNMPVAQSGYKKDGAISGAASTIAKLASSASKVPIIGPYAESVSKIAGVASSVAGFFGFTNEPVITDVTPMKQVPFQLASSEISEPVMKLSLQPKQSVSLGASQFGGPKEDELALQQFIGRSSFVVGSDWLTTSNPGTPLFTTAVSPNFFQTSATQIAHTPMSYIARMFQYWRGSIKITIKVIRSPYHRGRLQLSWDRAASGLNQGAPVGSPNVYNTIVDLDEDSEVSMVIPYSQSRQFLATGSVFPGTQVQWSTSGLPPSSSFPDCNGVFNVTVLNRLTAPEPTSSARLLIFVSAEDDFQFAGPREFNCYNGNNFVGLSANTAAVAQSKVDYDDNVAAHDFGCGTDDGTVNKETFGERIVSLRELLHRSSASVATTFLTTPSNAGTGVVKIPFKRLPPPPGVYNNGWTYTTTSSGTGQLCFFSRYHPLLAICSCFIGYKGSVNVAINVDQPVSSAGAADTLSISRVTDGGNLVASARIPSNASIWGGPSDSFQLRAYPGGAEGMGLTNTKTNTGMVANLPYYLPSGFSLFDAYGEYSNTTQFTSNVNDWWEMNFRYNKPSGTTSLTGAAFTLFYGSGPDFDVVFFINVPVLTSVGFTPV